MEDEEEKNKPRELAESAVDAGKTVSNKVVQATTSQVGKQVIRWVVVAVAASGGGVLLLFFFLFLAVIIVAIVVVILAGGVGGGSAANEEFFKPPPIEEVTSGDGTAIVGNYCQFVLSDPSAVCSTELEKIFEAAGLWAKIPAGVLVGIASIEGYQIFEYNNIEILNYSASSGGTGIDGQGIDPQNSTPNGCSAIGPMQFLIDFDPDYPPAVISCGGVVNPPNVWAGWKGAVNVAGVASIPNPDARNIQNAIYGAAWKLKCQSGADVPAVECSSGDFTSFDYNDATPAWEAAEVEAAAGSYLGACVDPSSGFPYCDIVWNIYQAVADYGSQVDPSGWPTRGTITQGPYNPGGSHTNMSAVDIAFPEGEKIYATQDGQIYKRNQPGGCGLYLEIAGSNFRTQYCHLESYSVCVDSLSDGDWVERGELIGYMGWTGDVQPPGPSGSHLHYAIKDLSGLNFISLESFNQLVPTYSIGDLVIPSYTGVNCQ